VFKETTLPLDKTVQKKESALYVQIFDRIRQWIRMGKLKEGDMLPSERELAEVFDVSRVPVREALKVLEFVGVVQNIHGKGVFVKKITVDNIIGNIDFVMMNPKHTMLDLYEVRAGIEVQAAYLAAERRTDEDIAAMSEALEAINEKDEGNEGILKPSVDFHSAVIKASHNLALSEINQFLVDWLSCLRQQFIKTAPAHNLGLQDHREVFERIKAGDSQGASQRMQEHLARSKMGMIEAVREAGDGYEPA
jgi:GntR family transcriptional repressor for pyruvate dehydrogenase complex